MYVQNFLHIMTIDVPVLPTQYRTEITLQFANSLSEGLKKCRVTYSSTETEVELAMV